jgi:hypothetical protein
VPFKVADAVTPLAEAQLAAIAEKATGFPMSMLKPFAG